MSAQAAVAAGRVVVMGVSGCGKSTVGRAVAGQLGWRYIEGDELHPPENVARMAAGTPLTDADRQGWLETIAQSIGEAARGGRGLVVTCSSLKRRYRDLLRTGDAGLYFLHLHGPREVLEQRLTERKGHYMPASLLQSQLDALEPPAVDERALTLAITETSEDLARQALAWLRGSTAGELR